MLSRVYTTSKLAAAPVRAVSCRYMATGTKNPPPQQMDLGSAPQPKSGPNTSTTATQDSHATAYKSPGGFNFESARLNLPVRLYNKSGVLASRLYALTEHTDKADVDKVATSLKSLNQQFKTHPQLLRFFLDQANTPEQKKLLLKELTGPLKLHPTLVKFFDDLWKKDVKFFTKMANDFETLIMARDKVVDVTVTLAEENQARPSPKQVVEVLKYSEDTNVNLKFVVDPKIQGGAILSSKDKFADFSFARIVKEYKAKLEQQDTQQDKQTQEAMELLRRFPQGIEI